MSDPARRRLVRHPTVCRLESVSSALRRPLRRQDVRVLAAILIAALALSVGLAHSGMARDHMGEAVAICLAVGATAVAVASVPHLGRHITHPPRPRHQSPPVHVRTVPVAAPYQRARGHPSLLQIFRR